VQRGLVIRATGESPKVYVSRAFVGQGRDAHFAKQVQAVCRDCDSDLAQVVNAEARQLRVAQVLDGSEVLGLVLCPKTREHAGVGHF
jgi:hypothetical protein